MRSKGVLQDITNTSSFTLYHRKWNWPEVVRSDRETPRWVHTTYKRIILEDIFCQPGRLDQGGKDQRHWEQIVRVHHKLSWAFGLARIGTWRGRGDLFAIAASHFIATCLRVKFEHFDGRGKLIACFFSVAVRSQSPRRDREMMMKKKRKMMMMMMIKMKAVINWEKQSSNSYRNHTKLSH